MEPIEEENSGFVRRGVQHPYILSAPTLPASSIDALKIGGNHNGKQQSITISKSNSSSQLKYSNSFSEQRKPQQFPQQRGEKSAFKRPISAPITESKFSGNRIDENVHIPLDGQERGRLRNVDLMTLNPKESEESLQLQNQIPVNPITNGIPTFDPSIGIIQVTNSLAAGSTLSANQNNNNHGLTTHGSFSTNQPTPNYNLPLPNSLSKGAKSYFNYNSNNFSNSKTIVSAIYSSHYLKTPNIENVQELPPPSYTTKRVVVGNPIPSNHIGNTINTGGVFVTASGLPNASTSLRPKSAVSSMDSAKPSVVDRALSLGKLAHLVQQPTNTPYAVKNMTRNTKLAEMLDSNILEKLDNAIRSSSNNNYM